MSEAQNEWGELPSAEALWIGLSAVLGVSGDDLAVLARRQNTYSSSSLGEIVICSVRDQPHTDLFVKYETPLPPSHGHRGGVQYEAKVHERVLEPLGMRTVRYVGSFETAGGRFAAVYEWLCASLRVSKSTDPSAMPSAAAWIGHLHRVSDARADENAFLLRYSREYFAGWVARTIAFAPGADPWLEALGHEALSAFEDFDSGPTLIHGEYYPQNILVREGRVYPVDWETAAIAPGEVDLAALTEGWDAGVTDRCVGAYVRARWKGAPPESFRRRMDLARIYLSFRWLGDRPEWTLDARSARRYERLRRLGIRLGLLDARDVPVTIGERP